jgi:hypothetical protein
MSNNDDRPQNWALVACQQAIEVAKQLPKDVVQASIQLNVLCDYDESTDSKTNYACENFRPTAHEILRTVTVQLINDVYYAKSSSYDWALTGKTKFLQDEYADLIEMAYDSKLNELKERYRWSDTPEENVQREFKQWKDEYDQTNGPYRSPAYHAAIISSNGFQLEAISTYGDEMEDTIDQLFDDVNLQRIAVFQQLYDVPPRIMRWPHSTETAKNIEFVQKYQQFNELIPEAELASVLESTRVLVKNTKSVFRI